MKKTLNLQLVVDWDLELKIQKLETMITVYEEHIESLEKENDTLKNQLLFLQTLLEYKTLGKPLDED